MNFIRYLHDILLTSDETKFLTACRSGDMKVVRQFQQNMNQKQLLFGFIEACSSSQLQIANTILDHIIMNVLDYIHIRVDLLKYASSYAHIDLVKRLTECNSYSYIDDYDLYNALKHACLARNDVSIEKSLECISILLSCLKYPLPEAQISHMINHAAHGGNIKILTYLCNQYKNVPISSYNDILSLVCVFSTKYVSPKIKGFTLKQWIYNTTHDLYLQVIIILLRRGANNYVVLKENKIDLLKLVDLSLELKYIAKICPTTFRKILIQIQQIQNILNTMCGTDVQTIILEYLYTQV